MRYIIFDDGYHDNLVLGESNSICYNKDLMKLLAKPHTENYEIRFVNYEDAEYDSEIPEVVYSNYTRIDSQGNHFSAEEFNQMWKYAEKITD